jgi:hypothetical protein
MVGHRDLARPTFGGFLVLGVERGDGRRHHAWRDHDGIPGFRRHHPMGDVHGLEDQGNALRLPAIRRGAHHGFGWDLGCHFP